MASQAAIIDIGNFLTQRDAEIDLAVLLLDRRSHNYGMDC
jgi:hypothetical protein